jgi:hypothetical protein
MNYPKNEKELEIHFKLLELVEAKKYKRNIPQYSGYANPEKWAEEEYQRIKTEYFNLIKAE